GGVGTVSPQACRVVGVQYSGVDTAHRGVEVVASVRQEDRPCTTAYLCGCCRLGFAALRRDLEKASKSIEEDHTVAVPGAVPASDCVAERLRRSSGSFDLLELAVGEKRD